MALVVGVDSSTSACKVQVRDVDTGEVLAHGSASHPATTPPRSEQDPHDWERAFVSACAQAGVGATHSPDALSIAGQQHGCVIVDGQWEPLRPAKLWNDTESAPDAAWLTSALGGSDAWVSACGSALVPSFTITKLRWIRRCEPHHFRRMESVLLPHDWLSARLTGRRATDRGDASGTGYWSPAEDRYRTDLLELVDDGVEWGAMLPEVLGPREPAGEWRGASGIVAAGTGDNMAAALGLGLRPGDLALSFGTSATAFMVADRPLGTHPLGVCGFADATGRYLPLVCTLNATVVLETVARLLGTDLDELDRLACSSEPGARGLTLVPRFAGERTPDLPDATGSLLGLRTEHGPADIARAAVEGVVSNLLEAATPLGLDDPVGGGRVFLVGGGTRSSALRRAAADLLGRRVAVVSDDQLVARGAAVQAAAALTDRDPLLVADSWGPVGIEEIEPDPTVDHRGLQERFRSATEQLSPVGPGGG